MIQKGRVPKSRQIVAVRELRRDELGVLREARAQTATQRYRDPHHRLARMLAVGIRPSEVAARAGYSYARLAMLMKDPGFQNLIAEYRRDVQEQYKENADEMFDMATANMVKAERMLSEKLEEADENGELLPTRDLIAITSDRMDRFGYGKKQTNLNVNVDFALQLQKAIARSGKVQIEAKAEPSRTLPPAASAPPLVIGAAGPLRRRA